MLLSISHIVYWDNLDLCGYEVAPDYPHTEVENPEVNHFPDGVFQKCRIIKLREKEAEREKLKKIKRNRKPTSIQTATSGRVIPVVTADDWGDESDNAAGASNATDDLWDRELQSNIPQLPPINNINNSPNRNNTTTGNNNNLPSGNNNNSNRNTQINNSNRSPVRPSRRPVRR